MQPPGWRGGSPGPLGRQDDCRGSASRERNHGVGDHPIPFRTRQLSPTSPKVLRRQAAGGQVVPLAGGAFLRSGPPGGTAGPADAAAPAGARPRPLFGARRGAEAARPRGGAIPGACRTLADFPGRTCATKLYYYLDAHAGVFLFLCALNREMGTASFFENIRTRIMFSGKLASMTEPKGSSGKGGFP